MALPCLSEGRSLLLLLFTITHSGRGEVLLIHESGKGTAWGYSHLPSTFPLTWSQARSACEAIPGSMLARVDGWQAEAAVEEYLREAAFAEPVWLANRQTLPEVLEDEQREMNHIGNAGVLGSDPSMGGEVGVTLRCAVYRAGVGLVHELCSEAAVSAALCVQRLSSERPQLELCPASLHRQWFLVNSHTETDNSEPHQQTTVNVIGLHQCHHHHHHHGHMARVACSPQEGWELTASICSSEASEQQQVKTPRTGHRQKSGASPLRQTPALTPTYVYNDDYKQILEQKKYFSLPLQQENRRPKRLAEFQPTRKVKTSSVTSSLAHSIPDTNPTHATHRSASETHDSDAEDKVMLYITSYKKSRNDYEKQREDAMKPQHKTHAQTDNKHDTDPRLLDASQTRLKDKRIGKATHSNSETNFDPIINEIEPEAESDQHSEGEPAVSFSPDKRNDSEAIHYSTSVEERETHTRTTPAQATESNDSQRNKEIKSEKSLSTGNTESTLKVEVGPIFVNGPEPKNNTNDEDFQPNNDEKGFRALVFPEDSALENPNENNLSGASKQPSASINDSSHEGSTFEIEKNMPSKEATTTPSRPIIFPRVESDDPASEVSVNDDTLLTENTRITESVAQPTRESTPPGTNSEMLPDVQISESMPVGDATPEDSAIKTEDMENDSDKNNDESSEDDVEEGIEDPNTNTPKPEESTLNPIISNTTSVEVLHHEPNSGPSSPHTADPTVTTEKPKTRGTRLLIAQIFKSIFG